jgi:hypothetical protein
VASYVGFSAWKNIKSSLSFKAGCSWGYVDRYSFMVAPVVEDQDVDDLQGCFGTKRLSRLIQIQL